jgi:hypothetical protein
MTTAAEKRHMDKVASTGCVICGEFATLHHPRFACGMSQRANNWLVIPLCAYHHQHGPHGQSIHNGQREFESNYGTEAELLAQTIQRITK